MVQKKKSWPTSLLLADCVNVGRSVIFQYLVACLSRKITFWFHSSSKSICFSAHAVKVSLAGVWIWRAQFISVAQSSPTLCDPMNYSTPCIPVHHQLPESTQTHVHWVGDAIQQSHPLSSPSPPALNLPQQQGLFKWVSSLHQVAKVLEFQLQHQSFQWIPRTDLL